MFSCDFPAIPDLSAEGYMFDKPYIWSMDFVGMGTMSPPRMGTLSTHSWKQVISNRYKIYQWWTVQPAMLEHQRVTSFTQRHSGTPCSVPRRMSEWMNEWTNASTITNLAPSNSPSHLPPMLNQVRARLQHGQKKHKGEDWDWAAAKQSRKDFA